MITKKVYVVNTEVTKVTLVLTLIAMEVLVVLEGVLVGSLERTLLTSKDILKRDAR